MKPLPGERRSLLPSPAMLWRSLDFGLEMDRPRADSKQVRGVYARRSLLASGIVIAGLAVYVSAATVLRYPTHWPLAALLAGCGAVLLILGLTTFWVPAEFR